MLLLFYNSFNYIIVVMIPRTTAGSCCIAGCGRSSDHCGRLADRTIFSLPPAAYRSLMWYSRLRGSVAACPLIRHLPPPTPPPQIKRLPQRLSRRWFSRVVTSFPVIISYYYYYDIISWRHRVNICRLQSGRAYVFRTRGDNAAAAAGYKT